MDEKETKECIDNYMLAIMTKNELLKLISFTKLHKALTEKELIELIYQGENI